MIFISCSKDDDNDDVSNDDLSISLGITGYKAAFYQGGYGATFSPFSNVTNSTEAISVTTNVGEPTVNVAEGTDPSIFYNPLTNRVEWTNVLQYRKRKLGVNSATIVATASVRRSYAGHHH